VVIAGEGTTTTPLAGGVTVLLAQTLINVTGAGAFSPALGLYQYTNRVAPRRADNTVAEFDPQPFQDMHLRTPGCTPNRRDSSACR
jgi:hypothetical protein